MTKLWGTAPWAQGILDLGIAHVRGSIGRNPEVVSKLQPLFAAGVKMCCMVVQSSGSTLSLTQAKSFVDFIATNVGPQNISGIEGPNEFNRTGTRPADWAAIERKFVADLHGYVRSKPVLNGVQLVAPSIWMRQYEDYVALGDLSAYVDRGCIHYYTGGRKPTQYSEGSLTKALLDAEILTKKPMWMTEMGWEVNGDENVLSRWVVTELAQAKYLGRAYFDYFLSGVPRSYVYALMDDEGTGHHWGLATKGMVRRRQSFDTLRRIVALVKDLKPATLTPLDLVVETNIGKLLLQKSDGTYILALWRDVASYDGASLKDISVAPISVSVKLGVSKKFKVHEPTFGTVIAPPVGTSLTVQVADHVVLVEIM
jgi:hypothetical protein